MHHIIDFYKLWQQSKRFLYLAKYVDILRTMDIFYITQQNYHTSFVLQCIVFYFMISMSNLRIIQSYLSVSRVILCHSG